MIALMLGMALLAPAQVTPAGCREGADLVGLGAPAATATIASLIIARQDAVDPDAVGPLAVDR